MSIRAIQHSPSKTADRGQGVILMLDVRCANSTEVVSGFGQLGAPAERLTKASAARMNGYIEASAYLADQLVLPFVPAGGADRSRP